MAHHGPNRRPRAWQAFALICLGLCLAPACADLGAELEQAVGRIMAEAMKTERGVVETPLLREWVDELGAEVSSRSPRQDLRYRFAILDTPEANAFSLPGGYIFVTAGLLENATGDDELACVLAHETAHQANRDFQATVGRALAFYVIGSILRHNDRDSLVTINQVVYLLESLRQSRREEGQADAVAVTLAVDAGYDPRGLSAFMAEFGTSPWSYLETVFSTHPHPTRRVEAIERHVSEIETADPARMMQVAAEMMGRARYRSALGLLEHVKPEPPLQAERIALEGQIALAQGRPDQARDLFHQALALDPGSAVAREGLAQAEAAAAPQPVPWDGLSAEQALALESAREQMSRRETEADEVARRAWPHLRRLWTNQQINRALELAQVWDPEIGSPAYLALVAQAWQLVEQCMQGGNLVARTLNLRSEVGRGMDGLARRLPQASPGTAQGGPVLAALADEVAANGPWLVSQSAGAWPCLALGAAG